MTKDYDGPGPGWREVPNGWADAPEYVEHYDRALGRWRGWVREKPVSPLPTGTNTVIRVMWEDPLGQIEPQRRRLVLEDDGMWWRVGRLNGYRPSELQGMITDFEVLASPIEHLADKPLQDWRRATAKAVIDRFRRGAWLDDIAREFGVSDE